MNELIAKIKELNEALLVDATAQVENKCRFEFIVCDCF